MVCKYGISTLKRIGVLRNKINWSIDAKCKNTQNLIMLLEVRTRVSLVGMGDSGRKGIDNILFLDLSAVSRAVLCEDLARPTGLVHFWKLFHNKTREFIGMFKQCCSFLDPIV